MEIIYEFPKVNMEDVYVRVENGKSNDGLRHFLMKTAIVDVKLPISYVYIQV